MIELKDVEMTFYTEKETVEVLKQINLDVSKNEIIAIVGPSGAGKTTILNILSGMIKPTKGIVKIYGKLGYMFQNDHLLAWRNVLKNVLLGLEIKHNDTKEKKAAAINLLNKYNLGLFIKSYPKELSGGMRQRIALIRTLITNPDILLLDEPFSALDYQTRLNISNDVFEIIKQEQKTAIFITHDISEAISLSDRVIILSNRPATIKSIVNIDINNLLPLERRKSVMFNDYFQRIWGILNE